jgi:glucose uptake protein GlcU
MELVCPPANNESISYLRTRTKQGDQKVAWKGYAAVAVAVLGFGSNFIPARKIEPGNGLYFQFFMSTAIMLAGFVVQMIRGNAIVYPYAMLGGMLWCIGNTIAMPALKLLSMGLAISIWGGTNMLLGWASGHFGFIGLKKEEVKVQWISYCSVAFAAVGVFVLAFVKKTNISHGRRHAEDLDYHDITGYNSVTSSTAPITNPFERVELVEKADDIGEYLSKPQQRVLGVLLSIGAGCFFGINFDPPTRLMDDYSRKSLTEDVKYGNNGLDYVFSHFFGIFCTAIVELVIFTGIDTFVYLPAIFVTAPYEKMILPGFLCGVAWTISQISWFIANDNLGLVVWFPIIALGPSIVASLWSVFLFGEIRGQRNYLLLG